MQRKGLKIMMLFAFALPFLSGCNTNNKPIEKNQFDLWSTYSTTKVLQNTESLMSYYKLPASIDIEMMKGEKESSQLIITAKRDIKYYALEKFDLSDSNGHFIKKEDISIFAQKYILLKRMFDLNNKSMEAGDLIPDMLLPQDISISYHENFIKNNTNQGLTVEVKTTKDTKAGIYEGTFKLYLDDEVIDIPVKVNVWDIDGSGKHDFKSCFLVYQNYLPAGEFNNTDELLNRYNEFLLDYQVCFEIINNEDKSESGVQKYLDYCFSFLDRDEYNSINLPLWFDFTSEDPYNFENAIDGSSPVSKTSLEEMYRYFKYLLSKTDETNNYISYTYWYATCLDEADMYDNLLPCAIRFFKHGGDWEKSLDYVINRLDKEGAFKKFSASYETYVKDYIKHFPAVYTNTQFGSSIENDLIATLCPLLSIFNSNNNVLKLQDYANRNTNNQLWTYTCSGPTNPYPTLHIDDFNLGTRVAGWMFKKYKINGYLYWAVNLYQSLKVFGSLDTVVDPYKDVERAGKVPGDGFLLYPGKYYGSDYPFASNRLANYRDCIEDYILISRYEEALNKYALRYGLTINTNDFIDDLYNNLFSGSIYVNDDARVFACRKELARRIQELENEDHLLIIRNENDLTDDLKIYTTANTIKFANTLVDGEPTEGGYYYEFNELVGTVNFETTNKKYVYELGEKGYLFDFNNPSQINYSIDEVSSVEFISGVANIDLIPHAFGKHGEIDAKTKIFRPYIEFDLKTVLDMKSLKFDITNNASSVLEAKIELVNIYDDDNESLTILIDPYYSLSTIFNFETLDEAKLKEAVKIRISVDNVYSSSGKYYLCSPSSFTMSSIAYKK